MVGGLGLGFRGLGFRVQGRLTWVFPQSGVGLRYIKSTGSPKKDPRFRKQSFAGAQTDDRRDQEGGASRGFGVRYLKASGCQEGRGGGCSHKVFT